MADEMVNESEKYPIPSPLQDAGSPSTTAALMAVPARPYAKPWTTLTTASANGSVTTKYSG